MIKFLHCGTKASKEFEAHAVEVRTRGALLGNEIQGSLRPGVLFT